MKNNLKKKGKLLSIAKYCEVEVSIQEDGFKGSRFRAILEQNLTRVKGKKLRVCYKTMFNEDGVNPLKETIEICFIRPVPPECLNEGVVFKEGSVVDAYFNNDIMRFIRSQLRPHADWIGSKWVKSKNKGFSLYMIVLELKVLSQHMFRTGQLVEMTCEISESEKKKNWVRSQGDDRRKFLIKTCTISQNSSDEAEGKHLIVDICKIRPSPPRDICAEYSLNDYVEVVVTHGWRKGRVTEILLENKYKVYFAATKEDAIFNYTEIRLSIEWLGGGSWIKAHGREFENNDAAPIRLAQESPSNTLALESDEDDTVNDDATEIKSSRESHSNTSFLEATETETQNHEPVDGVELPLPQESDDMMDDVATPIIDPQEIPQGETMSDSDDKIALPKRISETGTKGVVLERINKRSNLKLVGKVETLLGKEFKKLEDSFLAPVDVKCILGDPELHSDLVEDVDCEFGRVVDLVKRGYRLKRQDWLNGSVDIVVAEAEVDENNSVPGIDATDQEKIEFLNNKVVSLEERVKYLEGLLNIRGETVKVNGQNADYELDETKLLQDYIDAKRKEIAKRNKNGVRPPREVDHQDEDDTDVEVNEPQEVEEQQEEDDTAVDVDVSDKESENPETNEDAEVNEDASEKPVKGTKKRGRGTKGKKKGVTSPREVEDDAEVDAKETENPKTNEVS
ncbi:BnaC09g53110D [Brassica napus]|uniref:BnaC09g53110D protein n=1 Tax=Brassica napus TaxID=3708 RepID=A0A078JD37_BRANA|nr:BnaC09g53110D [Brassica napus]